MLIPSLPSRNIDRQLKGNKILFLAMSGVRIYDQDLVKLGLTLPGFVERGRVIASLPSLGLLTLAAHTPDDWEIEYREFDEFHAEAAATIAGQEFAVVAISALTARALEAYRLAGELRALGLFVVLGGLHATALPQESIRHVDAVVQGEGESTWPALLRDLRNGHPKKIYSSSGAGASAPEARTPRYDLLQPERYNRLTLQTTRGCPLHCSFCAASRLLSPYRKKEISQIAREVEAILRVWPKPFVELADDNTFVDKRWGKQLASLLRGYPIRWFTETDISLGDDEELLDLLSGSGCAQVLIGLESASTANMRGLDKGDWKKRRHRGYREKIKKIQDRGITVNGCFILGFDHDSEDSFAETVDYIDDLGLAEVQVTLLTPFPGTELRKTLLSQNRMTAASDWQKYTLFDTTFTPALMTENRLREKFHWLMAEIYSADRVAQRKKIRKACLRSALSTL